jgi:hypothetical protein
MWSIKCQISENASSSPLTSQDTVLVIIASLHFTWWSLFQARMQTIVTVLTKLLIKSQYEAHIHAFSPLCGNIFTYSPLKSSLHDICASSINKEAIYLRWAKERENGEFSAAVLPLLTKIGLTTRIWRSNLTGQLPWPYKDRRWNQLLCLDLCHKLHMMDTLAQPCTPEVELNKAKELHTRCRVPEPACNIQRMRKYYIRQPTHRTKHCSP